MSTSRWSPPRLCRSTTASTTRPTWITSTWSRRSSLMPWQRTTFLRLLGIFLSWYLDHDAPVLSFYQDFFSGCMELLSSTVAATSTTLSSGKTFALEVWYNFLLHIQTKSSLSSNTNMLFQVLVSQREILRLQLSATLEVLPPWRRSCLLALLQFRWDLSSMLLEVKYYSLIYYHLILGLRMGLAWVQQGCWEVANRHLCQSGDQYFTNNASTTATQHLFAHKLLPSGPSRGNHRPCAPLWNWRLGTRLLSSGATWFVLESWMWNSYFAF